MTFVLETQLLSPDGCLLHRSASVWRPVLSQSVTPYNYTVTSQKVSGAVALPLLTQCGHIGGMQIAVWGKKETQMAVTRLFLVNVGHFKSNVEVSPVGVRRLKRARLPFPDQRVPYKSSIMQVV